MVQSVVQITGIRKTRNLIVNLTKLLPKAISEESQQFMKDVQKSAKLRAPRDKKELANSIHVELTGKREWTLFVDSPHGVFQERGFKSHWIHSDMIKGSNKLTRKGFFFVKKSTPFVKPALEHNLGKLAQRLSKATNKAIKRSKK